MSEEKIEIVEKKEKKKNKETKLNEKIANLQQELNEAKNAYYKAYADTENIKKRLQAEHANILKYRCQDLGSDILASLDNLERALANANPEDALTKGVNMVYQQLLQSLAKEGITPINAINQPFDAQYHHAIATEKVKGQPAGLVVAELQKGYLIKDRVLRHSLVKVSE